MIKKFNGMQWIKMNKIFGLWVLLVLGACKSEYTSLVERELASGQRYDSLIYGLHLGDSQKKFFSQCWELNKKGLVKQGPNNQYVELIQKELDSINFAKKIQTLFYGEFDADKKMVALRMKFSFDGWGIGIYDYYSDKLLPQIKDSLNTWFPGSNDFIEIQSEEIPYPVFVKVDGNRQVRVYQISDSEVFAKVEDLQSKYSSP